jgi:hypothetical protein
MPSALWTTIIEVSSGGATPGKPEGTVTIPNEVFNLVKSIVGAGVLLVSKPRYVSISFVKIQTTTTGFDSGSSENNSCIQIEPCSQPITDFL